MRTPKGAWALATWLFSISKDYPQHLLYAMDKGFWDMTASKPIAHGDELFFRMGLGSLAARFRVTGHAKPIHATDGSVVLHDEPPYWDGDAVYDARVWIEPLSVTPVYEPSDAELLEVLGYGPRATIRFVSPFEVSDENAIQFMRNCFYSAVDIAFPGAPELEYTSEHEPPPRRLAEIATRKGQAKFRELLLEAYDGRCAVTGTSVEGALEAAHIIEHSHRAINSTNNGILMRADVHRLFDRSLLRIRSRGRIEVDTTLDGTEYSDMKRLAAEGGRSPSCARVSGGTVGAEERSKSERILMVAAG